MTRAEVFPLAWTLRVPVEGSETVLNGWFSG